jgi:hypothetical protein
MWKWSWPNIKRCHIIIDFSPQAAEQLSPQQKVRGIWKNFIMVMSQMRWPVLVARMGVRKNSYGILVKKTEGKRPLRVDVWTILKWILERYVGNLWIGFIWLQIYTIGKFS